MIKLALIENVPRFLAYSNPERLVIAVSVNSRIVSFSISVLVKSLPAGKFNFVKIACFNAGSGIVTLSLAKALGVTAFSVNSLEAEETVVEAVSDVCVFAETVCSVVASVDSVVKVAVVASWMM